MTEIKINSKPDGKDHIVIASAFKFGKNTTPEQSFMEVIDAVLMFSGLNAAAARKTGLELSTVDVLDKFIDSLVFERERLINDDNREDAHDRDNAEQ